MNLRSMLYRAARLLGDVNAVRRGKVPQRIVRKVLGRTAGRIINKVVKR